MTTITNFKLITRSTVTYDMVTALATLDNIEYEIFMIKYPSGWSIENARKIGSERKSNFGNIKHNLIRDFILEHLEGKEEQHTYKAEIEDAPKEERHITLTTNQELNCDSVIMIDNTLYSVTWKSGNSLWLKNLTEKAIHAYK